MAEYCLGMASHFVMDEEDAKRYATLGMLALENKLQEAIKYAEENDLCKKYILEYISKWQDGY